MHAVAIALIEFAQSEFFMIVVSRDEGVRNTFHKAVEKVCSQPD